MSRPPTHSNEDDPKPPRVRPRWAYRGAFLLAGAALIGLIATGRFAAFYRAFRPSAEPPSAEPAITGMIWFVCIAPLLILAYDLGSQHATARRLGTGLWRGLLESWRVAWTRQSPEDLAYEFHEGPDDDPVVALLMGLGVAGLFPTFFLSAAPPLRTTRGVIWLAVAGLIAGAVTYCHRRAAAYLQDDPSPWSPFRGWARLNPDRFAPEGRVFVRIQIGLTVLLALWWLGAGALLVLSPMQN